MKVKYILYSLALMVLCGAWTHTNTKKEKIITWEATYRLKWSDYQAKPDMSSSKNALTWYSLEANSHMLTGEYSERVFARVDRSKSWVKDTVKAALPHEQLHFDITELYARMMRESLSELKEKSYERRAEIVTKMSADFGKLMRAEQERYDQETQDGTNAAKQEEWRADIQKRMKHYAFFK